jgi:adenylate kinase family enzyme
LWFDLAGDQMLKRLLYRASQSKVKRADDKEDVMKKRIDTFNKSIPIFDKYKNAK